MQKTLGLTNDTNLFLPMEIIFSKKAQRPQSLDFTTSILHPKTNKSQNKPQQQASKQKRINAKKRKLTNVRETCLLAEKNLLEVDLRVAMKRRGNNNDRSYNSKDVDTRKRALQNKNIQKVTHKVWKSLVYRIPKILGILKDRSCGNIPQSDVPLNRGPR